jgi:hypothetical protein
MSFVVRACLRTGVLFAVLGMGLGIYMGMTHEFQFAPVHAHVLLLGWVSMLLYGLVYQAVPQAAQGVLPVIHWLVALTGMATMTASLAVMFAGHEAAEPFVALGSILVISGAVLFAGIVFRATRAPALEPAPATVLAGDM